jgi:hypothetical protein
VKSFIQKENNFRIGYSTLYKSKPDLSLLIDSNQIDSRNHNCTNAQITNAQMHKSQMLTECSVSCSDLVTKIDGIDGERLKT